MKYPAGTLVKIDLGNGSDSVGLVIGNFSIFWVGDRTIHYTSRAENWINYWIKNNLATILYLPSEKK